MTCFEAKDQNNFSTLLLTFCLSTTSLFYFDTFLTYYLSTNQPCSNFFTLKSESIFKIEKKWNTNKLQKETVLIENLWKCTWRSTMYKFARMFEPDLSLSSFLPTTIDHIQFSPTSNLDFLENFFFSFFQNFFATSATNVICNGKFFEMGSQRQKH